MPIIASQPVLRRDEPAIDVEINQSSWMADGLIGACPLVGWDGDPVFDLVTGAAPTMNGSPGAVAAWGRGRAPHPPVMVPHFNNAPNLIFPIPATWQQNAGFTMACWLDFYDTADGSTTVASIGSDTGGELAHMIYAQSNGGTQNIGAACFDGTFSVSYCSSVGHEPHHCVFTVNSGNTGRDLYLDGGIQTATEGTTRNGSRIAASWAVGTRWSNGGTGFHGRFPVWEPLVWNYEMTTAQRRAVYDEIHEVYRKRGARVIFLPSGAGDTELTVAGDTLGHAADNVDLVENLTLAGVGDDALGHTAEAPTLTQAHALAVAGDTLAHAADGLTLTQAHTLAVDAALHAHSTDGIALTQAQLLVVAGDALSHAADAPALTQAHTLAGVGGDAIGHTADGVTLTQAHTLAVAECLHSHAADNLTLTVSSLLVVSDSAHAHSTDGIALTQAHTLAGVGADAIGHTADAPTLTQAHTLAGVGDDAIGHTAENVTVTTLTLLTVAGDALGHTADGLTLTQAHVLAVVGDALAHTADNVDLTQAHVLVVDDALHAHLCDSVVLGAVQASTPAGRVLVVEAEDRTLIIAAESRVLAIEAESRTLTIH